MFRYINKSKQLQYIRYEDGVTQYLGAKQAIITDKKVVKISDENSVKVVKDQKRSSTKKVENSDLEQQKKED